MTFEDNLSNIVAQLNENYTQSGLFFSRNDLERPNRDVIIKLLSDFKRLMFPGYFGSEHPNQTTAPFFVGSLLTSIHERLQHQIELALTYQAGGRTEGIRARAEEVCTELLAELPRIQKLIMIDVEAAFDGDPAAQSREQIIFSYPGLVAIFSHRISHELYIRGVPYIPRIMSEYVHSRTGIDINSGATIGEFFFIDHGTGVVIGETTEIGDCVKIYQGVTLGALSTRDGQKLAGIKRHPTIKNNVTIYSNVSILGGQTVIGEHSTIGGNAFITESIAPYSRVSVKNPELCVVQPGPAGFE